MTPDQPTDPDAEPTPGSRPTRVHATALVEPGVHLGQGTSVWDSVHIRGPNTRVGDDCIVGEKSYLAYGVTIGDRCKLNAFVYVCTAVTLETGVMVAAHVTFTNDRYPRATTPDLRNPLTSDVTDDTLPTLVREGATIGAAAVIGPGLTLGRFCTVGMGSVVPQDVPDFALVVGNPARVVRYVCRCGPPLPTWPDDTHAATCTHCGRAYTIADGRVTER